MKKVLLPFVISSWLLSIISCGKQERPDPAVVLAQFIPPGWTIELDTTGPLLDSAREGHLAVLRHYDSTAGTVERMVCVIGPDTHGTLQRFASTKSLLPGYDLKSDTYIPLIRDMIALKKNVISLTYLPVSPNNKDCHWKEQYKFRFDPKSKRFRLIGFDFVDVTTNGWSGSKETTITTIDSRNYLTRSRLVVQLKDKDTVFHRQLKTRHARPFIEDIKPGELVVDTKQLIVPDGPMPEDAVESALRYLSQTEQDDVDTTEADSNPNTYQL